MKKIVSSFLLTVFSLSIYAQTDLSGAYGYDIKLKENTGNDKNATGPTGNLVLLKMEGNKYRFWLDVTIGWPSYNSGETDGTITIVNDTASFDNTFEGAIDPCVLKFKITNNVIHISSLAQSFNCGFGNGVVAEGDYTKLKNQPVLNYEWLKKEYHQSPQFTIITNKAALYQDQNCLHPFTKSQYFSKGDTLLSIAESEKSIYTEFITSSGKFMYGWIKKSAIKIIE